MLKIINANKYFNKGKKNEIHVIDNTSITLNDTGFVALLGPSGCGKTTLLNVIGGLDKLKKGQIYINDKKISSKCAYKVDKIRNIDVGYIFQDYKLLYDKTVFDNVAIVLKMIGIKDKKEIKKRVEYILDKVGMLRYRKRPASMLSGGEKQRVAIARALVKNPHIVLADEPTGNLDSRNSLEIMKILQAISKDKLVILVTHERKLAEFYANRIIEIRDGKIISDKENNEVTELDYQIDSTFYLKDFENHNEVADEDYNINIYSSTKEKINLDLVVVNGNIYIRSNTSEKVEVVDDYSSIEFKNEHYRATTKEDIDKYNYELSSIEDPKYKKKYSSIYNVFTAIIAGVKKIFSYSLLKKMLLIGFFLSGIFIMYAVSSIEATYVINDSDFVRVHRDYLMVNMKELKVKDYLSYEKLDSVIYMMPGDSNINFRFKFDDFIQTDYFEESIRFSIAKLDLIKDKDLVIGNMVQNKDEVVIDSLVADELLEMDYSKIIGLKTYKKLIGRKVYLKDFKEYTIVGIVDTKSPCIYVDENDFVNINYYNINETVEVFDYNEYKDKITIKKGRRPINDYEVLINYNYKDDYKLNKKINYKINNTKLKVVGYYTSKDNYDYYFVNNNTIKYKLINDSSDITIYSNNKEATMNYFKEKKINIIDTYEDSKTEYLREAEDIRKSSLIAASIVLIISLIEIFLMVRSSFLSRIKEIGTLRAIGVKKTDIYKMFMGEIVAITTIGGVPGILFSSYILKLISENEIFTIDSFVVNSKTVIMSIIIMYVFNLIIGLLPVYNTIKKTPASILARYDLD